MTLCDYMTLFSSCLDSDDYRPWLQYEIEVIQLGWPDVLWPKIHDLGQSGLQSLWSVIGRAILNKEDLFWVREGGSNPRKDMSLGSNTF